MDATLAQGTNHPLRSLAKRGVILTESLAGSSAESTAV
jgi:hypothetical protein